MRILLMDNDFHGAYGSLGTFLAEIRCALTLMGHDVVVTHSVDESVAVVTAKTVDFSLGIGKYGQFLNGVPFYDACGIRHYQWVIDCPYKIVLDTESTNVTYLFIDRDFGLVNWGIRNRPLFLPLGVPPDAMHRSPRVAGRLGVVFAGQVKDSSAIRIANRADKGSRKIQQAIDFCLANLSRPFLSNFNEVTSGMDVDECRSLFRPVNSFVRAYKRELVISHITFCPVLVVGEICSRVVMSQRNVRCVGPVPYVEAFERIGAFGYALNVEPNFNSGRHDRVIRAPFHSALPITNAQVDPIDGLSKNLVEYDYDSVEATADALFRITEDEFVGRMELLHDEICQRYAWSVLLQRIIDDYLEAKV